MKPWLGAHRDWGVKWVQVSSDRNSTSDRVRNRLLHSGGPGTAATSSEVMGWAAEQTQPCVSRESLSPAKRKGEFLLHAVSEWSIQSDSWKHPWREAFYDVSQTNKLCLQRHVYAVTCISQASLEKQNVPFISEFQIIPDVVKLTNKNSHYNIRAPTMCWTESLVWK